MLRRFPAPSSHASRAVFLHDSCSSRARNRLQHSPASSGAGYRFDRGGWMFVHLEGTPAEIGFQHGQLLSAEIADLVNVIKVETQHDTKRDWNFYRETGRKMLWPHIDAEYQQELEGIAKGVQSKGVKLDVWDIVALNGCDRVAGVLRSLAQQAASKPLTLRIFVPKATAPPSSLPAAIPRAARSWLRTTTGPAMPRASAGLSCSTSSRSMATAW